MTEIIINADDFGISKGVNRAIIEMHRRGNLTGASLMACAPHSYEAIDLARSEPGLEIGLHFNLTTGKSVAGNKLAPLLAGKNDIFRHGFLKLLFLSVFEKEQFEKQVKIELQGQLLLLKTSGIKPSHIDGHRHIHYLPGVFKIVSKVAKEEGIPRIRIINESLIHTLLLGKLPPISGIIKWFVLKFLGIINGASRIKSPIYFFSIIHSCRISNSLFKKFHLPKKYDAIEIMLHPALKTSEETEYEKTHLLSPYRKMESQFIKPNL